MDCKTKCSIIGCEKFVKAKGLCNSHYSIDWQIKNPEKRQEHKRKWYKHQAKNYYRRKNRELKIKVLQHYSGEIPICNWPTCNIDDIDVLSIDHIEGKGTQHRLSNKIFGTSFYRWLIRTNYPSGYQVLCMNHQFKKRFINKED